MSAPKLIVHTDIVIAHLCHHQSGESDLRLAMAKFFCYTTVFNAIELFSLARSARERQAVTASLSALKVLGVNARSAPMYGALIAGGLQLGRMNTLVAGVCLETRIPLLTKQLDEFRSVKKLSVIDPSTLTRDRAAAEVLRLNRNLRRT